MSLTFEQKLLLLLFRPEPSPEALDEVRAIVEGASVDLSKVLGLASMNQVIPLLYRKMRTLQGVPTNVMERLEKTYLGTFRRNALHSRDTLDLISILENEGVDAIALKGSLASDMIFKDLGLYPTGDIDILVKPIDLERAKRALKKRGFRECAGLEEEDLLESSYHLIFEKGANVVEVHWNLVKWTFEAPADFWWEDSAKTEYEGRELILLSPERYLLYAVFHLFIHRFRPLKFFLLVTGLLDKYRKEMDWEKLVSAAARIKMTRLTLFTLQLVKDLLGASVPDSLANRRTFGYALLKRTVLSGLFHERTRGYVRLALYTTLLDTPFDTARVLMRRVFPPPSEIRLRYRLPVGSKKIYAYYLLNPFLLFLRKRS